MLAGSIIIKAKKVCLFFDKAVDLVIEENIIYVLQGKKVKREFNIDFWTHVRIHRVENKCLLVLQRSTNIIKLILSWPDAQRQNHHLQLSSRFSDLVSRKLMHLGFEEHFDLLEILGEGVSSKVYRARNIYDLQLYAVKRIEEAFLNELKDGLIILHNELNILTSIKHPNIVKLHRVYYQNQTFFLVFDLLEGPSLQQVLQQKKQNTPEQIKDIMGQVLKGLEYLHNEKIIHRDIKPSNLVFAKPDQKDIIIVDFGLSIKSTAKEYYFPKCGTPGYVAPEIMRIKRKTDTYSNLCDMFSLGVVFHKLMTGKSLVNTSNYSLKDLVNACNALFQQRQSALQSKEALQLLRNMLAIKPTQRITAAEALSSPYLKPQLYSKFGNDSDSRIESETTIKEGTHQMFLPLLKKMQCKCTLEQSTGMDNCQNMVSVSLVRESREMLPRDSTGALHEEYLSHFQSSVDLMHSKLSFYCKTREAGLQRLKGKKMMERSMFSPLNIPEEGQSKILN